MTLHPYHRSGMWATRLGVIATLLVLGYALFGEAGDTRTQVVRIGAAVTWALSVVFWVRMSSGMRLMTLFTCLTTAVTFLVVAL